MDIIQIDDLKRKLIALVEKEGADHYSFTETEERKGGQRYVEFKVCVKIK